MCYFYLVSRKETLSKLPPQTLNVHMTSQTLIFLLALYSCTASASGSHSLDHHQTPPGAGLMSLSSSLFPFCSCFSTDQFIPFSVQTCSFFNFFPPLPLFRGTAGKSFFWHIILSFPSRSFYGYIHSYVCVCVHLCARTHRHTHMHPYIYLLTDCWYIPVWSKKDGQGFYIKHNKDSGPSISRPLESAQKISFKILTGQE